MLDYKGLAVLLELMAFSPPRCDMAAESLLALASIADHVAQKKGRSFPSLNYSATPNKSEDNDLSSLHPLMSPFHTGLSLEPSSTVCHYLDSDHCPFDMTIAVSAPGSRSTADQSGSTLEDSATVVRLPVHSYVLQEASEVFKVMLGGCYLESDANEVFLRDVHPQSFKSILHHMYGCGWLCSELTQKALDECQDEHKCTDKRSRELSDYQEAYDIIDSAIAAVVSHFELPREQAAVAYTLHSLVTASRFLLPKLCTQCERQAAAFLSPATVVAMFLFSQLNQSCWLSEQCVHYLLRLPPSLQRRSCLQALLGSPEGPTALDMIRKFIVEQLGHIM